VRQLDRLYPHLGKEEPVPGPTSTIGAPVEHLELATVLRVLQAVSGEIVHEKLVDTVLRTAIEHAGADRGVLIVPRGDELRIQAEGRMTGSAIAVRVREMPISSATVPESVVRYAARAQEIVSLDDASTRGGFENDDYVRREHALSVLCLPLLQQGQLMALLYLENNLAAGVFTPARMAVLNVLASQAAMSLENTRLYRDLTESESRIRRLVDANIIGIFIWELEGRILEANDAFLTMVGYDREDLVAGRLHWTDLTPPEWHDQDERLIPELTKSGTLQPFEKEYVRKDGSRVPVLIGVAHFEETGNQGVAFVLDLTERKRAQNALQVARAELAHATRLTTMGELTASIAHEVKQPITAAVTSARTALRWLEAQPPELGEVREALSRIVRAGKRAGDVIGRIRALVTKAPPRKDSLEINAAIREVVELTSGEAVKNGISVRMDLAEGLPLIQGDRVQLQQVILNLIINGIEAMTGVGEASRDLLISSKKDDAGGVLVGVADTGPGLAAGALEQVFAAFYTTKPGGLGLGLSICRSIVEAHDGRLWASANELEGATFQFSLPAAERPAGAFEAR
jgi:PAS domain S-box-containing protein